MSLRIKAESPCSTAVQKCWFTEMRHYLHTSQGCFEHYLWLPAQILVLNFQFLADASIQIVCNHLVLKAHSPPSTCKLYLLNVQFLLTIAISGFSVSSISHPTVSKSCHFFFTATWICFPFLNFPYWSTSPTGEWAPAHSPKAGARTF